MILEGDLFRHRRNGVLRDSRPSVRHCHTGLLYARIASEPPLVHCVLDLKTGRVTELVKELKGGVFGRFDLSFDATRIIFDWKGDAQQDYRIGRESSFAPRRVLL